jgi:NAD(P) transhydrogenase subunit alpha
MNIAVMKECHPGETRIPMVPATVDRLIKLGAEVVVEAGVGLSCRFNDEDYHALGATVSKDRCDMLANADMVLRLRKPPREEIGLMRRGTIHVSYLDPFRERELVEAMVSNGISGVSLEMVPRTTLAQKMDVLSS